MKKVRSFWAWFLVFAMIFTSSIQMIPMQVQAAGDEINVYSSTTMASLNNSIANAADGSVVKLNGDLVINENRIIFGNGKNIILDLNGYTIRGNVDGMGSVIRVENATNLTLIDSKGNTNSNSINYNVVDEDGTSAQQTYKGGGITVTPLKKANHLVYVVGDSTFNMEGGIIYGGTSDENGAGIYATDSTVNLYSGVVANNYAANFGGGIALQHSNLNIEAKTPLSPAVISGNTAGNRGGGIYAYNGEGIDDGGRKGNPQYASYVTINDPNCYITDNQAYTETGTHLDCGGGGIRLDDDTVFVMNGGNVTGNTSGAGGGGIMAGYYNTTGWWDGSQSYQYIPEVDRVYVTINGGTISANKSKREGAGVSIGGNCNGVITGDDYTYITNNSVAEDTTDWGGGGLFVAAAASASKETLLAAGLNDYTGPGSLHIQKAIITDNTASGFGGGVAGCATARVFVNPEEVDKGEVINGIQINNNGVAIYGNTATAEHDATYHPVMDSETGTDHLSGTTSAKSEDRTYTNGNQVFWESGFDDYFCALNTQVGNTMLGGGNENWVGSSDGVYVQRIDYDANDQNIYSSYLTGLTSQAEPADITAAEGLATVEITGNTSGTHGGGVLANGVLVLGDVPTTLEVQDRIIINASKAVLDQEGNEVAHPDEGFTFDVFQYDGKKVAQMQSVTSLTDATLGEMNATFAYNGASKNEPWVEYTYFVAERGNQDTDYNADRSVYYIWITGKRVTEDAGDAFAEETTLDVATIEHVRIIKRTLTPDQFDYTDPDNPVLLAPISTGDDTKTLENDALWRAWQESYRAHVDADGNFVSTYQPSDDETDVATITNDNVTVVLDYDINNPKAAIFSNPNATIGEIIDLNTGTDHAKLLNLDKALTSETFINTENLTDVTVTKEWLDANGEVMTAAPAVTFELYQISTKTEDATEVKMDVDPITLDGIVDSIEITPWIATFKDIPKTDEEGYPYEYRVKELVSDDPDDGMIDYIPNYENLKDADGNVIEGENGKKAYALDKEKITNQFNQKYIKLTGSKTWDDDDNRDGKRPSSIKVNLYRNGQIVENASQTVTVTEEWKFEFTDLPKYDVTGQEYVYAITEDAVTGYTATITSTESTDGANYVITNSYNPVTTQVHVTKFWVDGNNADGRRPDSIVLKLYKTVGEVDSAENGEINDKQVGNSVTLTGAETSSTWTYSFTGLDVYENAGVLIDYYVKEESVEGYISGESSEPMPNNIYITNTELTNISFTKEWVNADGSTSAPEGGKVTFTLYADGEVVKKEDGTAATITLDGTVDINGEKNAWVATFENLPKYKLGSGAAIVYTAKETSRVAGYTPINDTVVAGGTITNRQETVAISATKAWRNVGGSSTAPAGASVVFTLYEDGAATAQKVTLDGVADQNGETKAWTAVFNNLPKYKTDGTEYVYTIGETGKWTGYKPDYSFVQDAGVITNVQDAIDVIAKKAWRTGSSTTAPEGAAVTFELYADGAATGRTVTLDGVVDEQGEINAWEATFSSLAEYRSDGKTKIEYTIRESGKYVGYAPDATSINSNGTITNVKTPDEVVGTVLQLHKVDQKGDAVKGATFELWESGTKLASATSNEAGDVTLTLDGDDLWADQKARTLRLVEVAPNGYTGDGTWMVQMAGAGVSTKTVEGTEVTVYEWRVDSITNLTATDGIYTVVNTKNELEEIVHDKITVNKVDTENQPVDGAKFTLYDGETEVATYTAELGIATIATGDEALKTILPAAGESKELSLKESEAPEGYHAVDTTWKVIVAAEQSLVIKNNAHVTITTYSMTVDGKETLVVENRLIKTLVSGTKTWDDNNNAGSTRPEAVTVRLYADNKPTDYTAIMNEENGWTYEFKDIDKYTAGGRLIDYTVFEDTVVDYETTYDETHLNVINTYPIQYTSVTAMKVWDDAENQDGIRPESITVQLTANGVNHGEPVSLSAENKWRYIWSNLEIYLADAEGLTDPITYEIREVTAVDGYEQIVEKQENANNIFVITNKHIPATTGITVTKQWDDANDNDGLRPTADEFKSMIQLMNGDVEVAGYEPTVTDNGDGTYVITYVNLPVNVNGVAADYSVQESVPVGYEADDPSAKADGIIVNRHVPEVVHILITKIWDDGENKDKIRPSADEFKKRLHLMKGNQEVLDVEPAVTDNNDGTYTVRYENLPKYQSGIEIVYSIVEDEISGYTCVYGGNAVEGFTITNTHTPKQDEPNTEDSIGDENDADNNEKNEIGTEESNKDESGKDKYEENETGIDENNKDGTETDKSQKKTGTIILIKTDEEGNLLSGAEFNLYKEGVDEPIATGLKTNSKGKIKRSGLKKGNYYLVETKAPNGYILPEGKSAETKHVAIDGESAKKKQVEVTMVNEAKTDTSTSKGSTTTTVTETGDGVDTSKLAWIFVGMLLLAGILFLLGRKYDK